MAFCTSSRPEIAAASAVVIDDEEALKAGRQITGAQLLSRRSWRIH